MERHKIIEKIGEYYYISNVEKGEFSYPKALKSVGIDNKKFKLENSIEHDYLDLRFENERVVVLVECKDDFSKWDKDKIQKQL